MNRESVTELIQNDFNEAKLEKELSKILDEAHRQKILEDYRELIQKLGGKGASEKVAKEVVK